MSLIVGIGELTVQVDGENKDMRSISIIQKRLVIFIMLLALAISFIVLYLFFYEDTSLKVKSLDSFAIGDNCKIQYAIEYNDFTSDGSYSVNGWIVKPGVVYSYYNYGNDANLESVYNNVHVGYIEGNNVYILPTKLEERVDVNQYINDGIDYKYCGFKSKIPKGKARNIQAGSLVLIWQNPDGSQELYYL